MQEATPRFTVSPVQRRLRSGPEIRTTMPWVQLAAVVHGPVDDEGFRCAADEVMQRHEALRTRVLGGFDAGEPFQVIDDATAEAVRVARWDADPRDRIRDCTAEESSRLDDSHPVLATMFRAPATAPVIVLTCRGDIADRRSLRIWLREIVEVLAERPQPPVEVQYADYAAWHVDLLADPDRSTSRGHWDTRVAEVHLSAADPHDTGHATRSLGPILTRSVSDLATGTATSEAAVLTAAWALLDRRLHGDPTRPLGALIGCRSHAGLTAAVGPFAREVPLRLPDDGDIPFVELVTLAGAELADAAEYADDLDPGRWGGSDTAVEFVDAPLEMRCGGFRTEPLLERSAGLAPILLTVEWDSSGARLELTHATDALTPDQATILLARLDTVLRSVVESSRTPVDFVPILLPGERDRLLAAAEGPAGPATAARSVHDLFDDQVRRTPEAVAVEDGLGRLTYAELAVRSDALGAALRRSGVGRGDLVPIMIGRSTDLLVAVLGVLKAGAGYVPVDPALPARRRDDVLRGVDAPMVVIGANAPDPAELTLPTVRCPGATAEGGIPASPSGPSVDPGGDIAYVLHTSGSTGRPRGVPVTHRSLLNYLLWAAEAYGAADGAAVVATSVAFDLTVTGLLAPLLVGGRVVLVPEEDGLAGLVAALSSVQDIALLKVTPSHLEAIAQLTDPALLTGTVRVLVVGGEALSADVLRPFRDAWPMTRIVNEYGPTETVVGCCAYVVPGGPAPDPAQGAVPIGRPVPGTSAHLRGPSGEPVPDGVVGELWIGGVGVSAGYLADPEATLERFIEDPLGAAGRVYRTGDRAVRSMDGDLVFVGRTDDQISLFGQRIEPGEIEAVLCEHPSVRQAAVVGDGGGRAAERRGVRRLVAFVVAEPGDSPAGLREFCRERLPASHVPVTIHVLPRMPINGRGKLDRAVLTERAATAEGPDFAAPATEVEEILAGAVASVLDRDRVGIDDNYFVIGGDSIRSVMIASRVQASGVDLTVADLHRHPTVRELAVAVTAAEPSPPEVRTAPFGLISPADRAALPPGIEDAFPLNLLQEGMIFHREFAARSAVYHAIATVRLRAPLRTELLRTVIDRLVARHPMLRTSFDLRSFSRPLQLVHTTFADPLSVEDLTGLSATQQEARIQAWVDREKERGFELHDHPLIRFVVHRLDTDTFQFTYGFHHEIVDGWSEALMVTELFGHYFSLVFEDPIVLPAPASSMRDAIALELEALGRQENYEFWSEYLRDASLMRLPRRGAGPVADKGRREIVRIPVDVPDTLSDDVKRLARDLAVPLKSVLLGAHMAVMNRYHGQDDTLTYTVTNGRPEGVDGSTAIGLFVNSLALRVRLPGGSWRDLVARTLDAERCSMPYRRLPMAELKRHQGNEPLAETLFFFTDYHVFRELDRWKLRGVEYVAGELYGESTFPFCAIFRLNRETSALEVRLEYDSLQFPAELMTEMGESYRRVLEAMVEDPDGRYDRASLLGDAERHILTAWGDGGPPAVDGHRIDDVISRWALRTPDAVAVTDGSAVLSYAGLLRAADALADALAAAGVRPGSLVGVLTDRTPVAVVALLGILRAGAVYVPIDSQAPPERVKAILDSVAPVVVLADPAATGMADGWTVLELAPELWRHASPVAERARSCASDVAYVLHTSGSSGTPKGVVVTHDALTRSTLARSQVYPENPDRFLLLSPLAVDSSMVGLLWPLAVGATVQLAPPGLEWEPAEICRFVERHGTTHLLAVPGLLAAVLHQPSVRRLRGLQRVITAGDACPVELPHLLASTLPACLFANEYGPTENAVWSTVRTAAPDPSATRVGIGRPVPGVLARVLDQRGRPAPVGVAGELHLSGVGLARGYHGDPGATAAVFGPDPFGPAAGSRLYRTGDLTRWTADGELEFLGRIDQQVKIRGFRVEPAEVEFVLDSHPAVHRSVVVTRTDGGEDELVGYVAVAAGSSVAPEELQRFVRDRLPRYMVPSTCVVVDALPVTPAGKVDRSALPAPHRPALSVTEPQTATEQFVADVWRDVLKRDRVGTDVDFFEVGGESLRAMHVVNRTNSLLGLDLPVRALFDAPTIAGFAATVAAAQARAADAAAR